MNQPEKRKLLLLGIGASAAVLLLVLIVKGMGGKQPATKKDQQSAKAVSAEELNQWATQTRERSQRITQAIENGDTRHWSETRGKVFLDHQKSVRKNIDKIGALGRKESYPASTRKLMKEVDDDNATLEFMLFPQ